MVDEVLAEPTDAEAIFLSVEGVPAGRPVMFGDVFRDLKCSRGGSISPLVMVMSHPCSMRRGVVLKERILTAEVAGFAQKLSSTRWQNGYFDFFPVPGCDLDDRIAVNLTELHSANSSDLLIANRVMALSDYGVTVLLQRWIYQMSRDPVDLRELEELVAPVMAEIELQELWCEAALRKHAEPSTTADLILNESIAFQDFIGVRGDGGLRDQMQDPARRAAARRATRERIEQRFGV